MLFRRLQLVRDGFHLLQLDSVGGDRLFEQATVELPPDVGEADVVRGLDLGLVRQHACNVNILQVEQRSVQTGIE